jgi:signal transduction histidine kinase
LIICALLIQGNWISRVVFYYTDDVKEKRILKKKIIMRTSSSPDYLDYGFNREMEAQVKNSGDSFSQIIENADGVPYHLVFGRRIGDGYYVSLGNGIKQLLGIPPIELTEGLFLQMIEETISYPEGVPSSYVELREKIMRGEIRKYKAEILIINREGNKKWIKDSAIPVVDEKTGRITGLIGIFFDISEQKQTQMLLEKAMERATESDRLKTAFLNNLSHEIRTPLNAIVGFSTLMGEPGHVHGNRMEFMDIITHSSDHLLEIVDDVLEISKIETKIVRVIKKEVNLNQLMQRVYDRFLPAATEKNIMLTMDVLMHEKEIIITTDGYKLFQSLTNLLSNAVKFTIEGKVEFGCHLKENMIEFYVCDTGIGIWLEHQPSIFKPFFQAESSSTKRYEGTGLGLSIAKAYINLLGGEIWFNSEPGEGSVFCFNIPDTRKVKV